jgi:predicted phosphoadenosine phosphosulfate sulfurtransferase
MGKKSNIEKYINSWQNKGYPNGIPDEVPIELEKLDSVPYYRKICIALMKNENNLESLGFSRKKTLIYSELKRIEIEQRQIKNKQLKLNL